MVYVDLLVKRLSFLSVLLLLLITLNSCITSTADEQRIKVTATPVPIDSTLPPCQPSCATAGIVPRIRPFIDTGENIHLFQSFDYGIQNPATVARYFDFVWGATPSKVAAFRSGNPKIFLGYYIPFHRDGGSFANPNLGKQHDLTYWKKFHPDWILYQCDRVTPAYEYGDPNIPLDFSNPALISWQVETYAQPASDQGYDAIAADNLNLENLFGACGVYKNGQWVQLYSGQHSDSQWQADIVTWVSRMQTALHALKHPLALIPNLSVGKGSVTDSVVQQVVSHVDGVLDEGGFTNYGDAYLTDNNWVHTIQFIKSVQQQNKAYYIVNEFPSVGRDQIQWALASYLMCNEHIAALFISSEQAYGKDQRYSEYTAEVGQAKDEMYQGQNVYWRDYTDGLSVINPSSSQTYTVRLSGQYTDLYGHNVGQTITLSPHSGMVLLFLR